MKSWTRLPQRPEKPKTLKRNGIWKNWVVDLEQSFFHGRTQDSNHAYARIVRETKVKHGAGLILQAAYTMPQLFNVSHRRWSMNLPRNCFRRLMGAPYRRVTHSQLKGKVIPRTSIRPLFEFVLVTALEILSIKLILSISTCYASKSVVVLTKWKYFSLLTQDLIDPRPLFCHRNLVWIPCSEGELLKLRICSTKKPPRICGERATWARKKTWSRRHVYTSWMSPS